MVSNIWQYSQKPVRCFPIMCYVLFKLLCPILNIVITMSSLVPRSFLNVSTLFWMACKCLPLASLSHLTLPFSNSFFPNNMLPFRFWRFYIYFNILFFNCLFSFYPEFIQPLIAQNSYMSWGPNHLNLITFLYMQGWTVFKIHVLEIQNTILYFVFWYLWNKKNPKSKWIEDSTPQL